MIAADTIVVCGGRILGKPGTEERAAEMLRLLSGRDHQVMTGFTVRRGSTVLTQTEVSHIFFRPWTREKLMPMWQRESRWTSQGPRDSGIGGAVCHPAGGGFLQRHGPSL